MASETSPTNSEADTVVQANRGYGYTAPADLKIRLANTRQECRALELQYWDLKWRFEALPHEVRWPEQEHLKKGAHQCREELEGRRSHLASLFASLTDTCNKIEAEIDKKGHKVYWENAKKAIRLRMWKQLDKPLEEVKKVSAEVETKLLTLEHWHRRKTLDEERARLQDRIERLNTFYTHILSSWLAINTEVRETARLGLGVMRLVIAAFEAPSSTTTPFQSDMAQIRLDMPNLIDADANKDSIQYIEGWSNCLGEQAAKIEAYLCKLRAAVREYQLLDKSIPKAREMVDESAIKSEKSVQGTKDLVQMAQKKRGARGRKRPGRK